MLVTDALRVGVVGTGSMGRNHVRLLAELPAVQLVGLFDLKHEVARGLAGEYGVGVFESLPCLFDAVDAVVVAVPTVDHAALTCQVLKAGRHVLVEKPMAVDLAEADRMIAAAGDLKLAVGHVEFFNPGVQRLLTLSEAPPRFVEVERVSGFTMRSLDVDVILDLMIHDLQIIHALDASDLMEVRAVGVDVMSSRVDIASARLELASGCVVNLTASRVSDQQVRRLRVFLQDSYYSLDYRDQAIKGFHLASSEGTDASLKGQEIHGTSRSIEPANVVVEKGEPLRHELEAFAKVCRGESAEWVDGATGRRALATALAVRDAVEARRVHG